MQSPNRSVIVNEDDNRKLEIYTQGDLDVTPSGIGMFASDANGTLRILKQDDKGNLNVNLASGSVSLGGTMAVYFDQSAPTVNATGAGGSISVNVVAGGAGGGVAQTQVRDSADAWADVGYSAGKQNMPVYIAGSAASSSLQIIGITNTVGVYVDTITSTVAVKFNGEPTVIASGKQGATTRPLIMNTDGAIKIYDIANGTVTVNGTVTANAGTGTLSVIFNSEPTVISSGKDGTTTRPMRMNSDGAIKVYDLAAGTVSISNIVNVSHTASVANAGNSVSGSTSGVSVSGVQIVAPEANRVIKVYAFSIMSTAAVNLTSKFTNGSGGSPVELWRVAMISPTGGVAGANLAVTPPGYLFACPSGATLCIVNDNASLIHYSVAYFKESA